MNTTESYANAIVYPVTMGIMDKAALAEALHTDEETLEYEIMLHRDRDDSYEDVIMARAAQCGLTRSALASSLRITTVTLATRLKLQLEWKLRELVMLSSLIGTPLDVLTAEAAIVWMATHPDDLMASCLHNVLWTPFTLDMFVRAWRDPYAK